MDEGMIMKLFFLWIHTNIDLGSDLFSMIYVKQRQNKKYS